MSKELEALRVLKMLVGKDIKYDVRTEYEIIEKALKDYELMKQAKIIVVDKKISDDDLEKLKNQRMFPIGLEESKVKLLFDEETLKKLKDFEWLKSVISIDMFEKLPTPEDKIRFLKIMGVEVKYE